MMYATAKEGGSTGAAYTQLFLSAAVAVSAGIFLQFMVLQKDPSELKGFCRRQWYNTSTCYTQEGFLGPKPSWVCFLKWKMTLTVDIHRRKQTYTDIYEKSHTIHCHRLKNSPGGKELPQNLTLSTPQSPYFFLSKHVMWLKQLPGGIETLSNPRCLTAWFPPL